MQSRIFTLGQREVNIGYNVRARVGFTLVVGVGIVISVRAITVMMPRVRMRVRGSAGCRLSGTFMCNPSEERLQTRLDLVFMKSFSMH